MVVRLMPTGVLGVALVLLAEVTVFRSQAKEAEANEQGPPPRVADVDPFVAGVMEVIQNSNVTWQKGANSCVALGKQGAKAMPALPAVNEFLDRFLTYIQKTADPDEVFTLDKWLAHGVQGSGEFGRDGVALVATLERVLSTHVRGRYNGQMIRFVQGNRAAAVALGKIGSPKSLPALVKAATEDKEVDVRLEVVNALAEMAVLNASAPEVVRQVVIHLRVISATDEVDYVQAQAAKMLDRIEGKSGKPKDTKAAAKSP